MITYNLIRILKNDLSYKSKSIYLFIIGLIILAIFLDIIFSPIWILKLICKVVRRHIK